MKFSNDQLDLGAEIINQHPGVSHNYRRNNAYNLWFTVAVPPADSLAKTIQRLHELSGALNTLILPTLKLFKIGVKLDLTGSNSDALDSKEDIYDESKRRHRVPDLSADEIEAIRLLQEDIPLVERPFETLSRLSGFSEEQLFKMVKMFKEKQKLKSQISGYQQQISEINSRNENLAEGVAKTESEDYIEKIAREQLDMQKEGETVVSFILPEQKPSDEAVLNSSVKIKVWLSSAWNSIKKFFGQ